MAFALMVCNLSIIASAEEIENRDVILTKSIVQENLSSSHLDVIIDDDNIKLSNPTPENIERANYLLSKRKAYSTRWVYRKNDDICTNKKIKAASKHALSAAITTMVTTKNINPGSVLASAVAGFGSYWYLNRYKYISYYQLCIEYNYQNSLMEFL